MLPRIVWETLLGTVDKDFVQLLTVELRFLPFLSLLFVTLLFLLLHDQLEVAGGQLAYWHAELVFHFARREDFSNGLDRPIKLRKSAPRDHTCIVCSAGLRILLRSGLALRNSRFD